MLTILYRGTVGYHLTIRYIGTVSYLLKEGEVGPHFIIHRYSRLSSKVGKGRSLSCCISVFTAGYHIKEVQVGAHYTSVHVSSQAVRDWQSTESEVLFVIKRRQRLVVI